jgi:hypothetical protein
MKFFQELNDLITETPTGKVLAVVLAIYIVAGSVGLGLAYILTRH